MNTHEFRSEERLVSEHLLLVKRVARPYFLAGGDGEDLIQEGTLGLISAIRTFIPERGVPFEAYAETCIRNRIISAVRKAAKEPSIFPLDSQDKDLPDLSPVSDPLELILARERALDFTDRLRSVLSELETSILNLFLEGIPYAEIAKRVHRDVKSVDNAVQRIRSKLRKIQTGVQSTN